MTNLTDKWKKGELPEGHYYVEDGGNIIAEYYDGYFYSDGLPMTSLYGGVDEVLAQVPSYEEWEKLSWYAGNGVEENQELKMENTKLKKQLAHVTRTQAKQFRDNQKLQVKAEHAKDVVNIDTARQIKQLKDLLKECKLAIFDYPPYDLASDKIRLQIKINQVLGEE